MMNKEGNKYIFLYSIVLVVVVAAVLAVASIALKPFQHKNIEVEKKQSILRSVHKAAGVKDAKNKNQYIESEYSKYITSSFVVNSIGDKVEGDAFEVNLEEEMAKPMADRKLPVFVCTDDDSTHKYILPVRGTGLWGPLWGYVALLSDYNTVCGVVFDHKGETPGLGAEISTPQYQAQFAGKQLFDGETFTSIQVVKGGGTQGKPHEVDAVSGGTITSKGLESMLQSTLSGYLNFIKEEKKRQERALIIEEVQPEAVKLEVKRSVTLPTVTPAATIQAEEAPKAEAVKTEVAKDSGEQTPQAPVVAPENAPVTE